MSSTRKLTRRSFLAFAAVTASSITLAACGATPTATPMPTATKPPATATPVPPTATKAPAATGTKVSKIGFSTDVGRIDDKSFNQSSWEGAQQAAKELGAEAKYVVTTDAKDYEKNIAQFADNAYDVIITSGFGYGEATTAAAKKYPKIKFIGVDQFQAAVVDNLVGLIFEEDKSGFLAGALAAQLTKSKVIGAVLGTDVVPAVVKFGKGYEAGAKYIDSTVKVVTAYHPGGLAKGFTDPDWGASTSKAMIDQQKADVIFGAGGSTGNGALLYCAGVNVMAIGVDSDQYLTLEGAQKILISSAMKLITPGVVDAIKSITTGTWKGGNVVGPVGLAPYHDWDSKIAQTIKDKIIAIDKGLKDGTIKTGVTV